MYVEFTPRKEYVSDTCCFSVMMVRALAPAVGSRQRKATTLPRAKARVLFGKKVGSAFQASTAQESATCHGLLLTPSSSPDLSFNWSMDNPEDGAVRAGRLILCPDSRGGACHVECFGEDVLGLLVRVTWDRPACRGILWLRAGVGGRKQRKCLRPNAETFMCQDVVHHQRCNERLALRKLIHARRSVLGSAARGVYHVPVPHEGERGC